MNRDCIRGGSELFAKGVKITQAFSQIRLRGTRHDGSYDALRHRYRDKEQTSS